MAQSAASSRQHSPGRGDSGAVLSAVLEQTGAVVYRYRLWPDPGYVYVSDSVTALLGYTPDALYADPHLPARIIHPDDHDLMKSVLDAPDGKELDLELRWIRPDGRVVKTGLHIVVTRDASGRAVQVDGIVRQILPDEEQGPQARADLPAGRGRTRVARVLLADDHELTRTGLRAVLAGERGLEVVGEATTGRQAASLVSTPRPDLVLMDILMPDMDGLEATRLIKQSSPTTCVLILSMLDDPELLLKAVKAGAAGYVLKASTEAEVRAAIWAALEGELPVDKSMAVEVLHRLAQEHSSLPRQEPVPQQESRPDEAPLSAREREVLVLLARGHTNREIAEALVITPHTVKVHVEHILTKLGVSDRTQAAVRGIELGYIGPAAR